jgi:hypothetical protein
MGCSSSKSTKKGYYNKANNLRVPTSYIVDKKGNVKAVYSKQPKTKNI